MLKCVSTYSHPRSLMDCVNRRPMRCLPHAQLGDYVFDVRRMRHLPQAAPGLLGLYLDNVRLGEHSAEGLGGLMFNKRNYGVIVPRWH